MQVLIKFHQMYNISKQEPNFLGADSVGFGLFGRHGYHLSEPSWSP